MRYKLDIAPQVQDQISETAEWYRQTSGFPEIGDEWTAGILNALETLTQSPDRLPLSREADGMGMEIRELHYGSGKRPTHRVLFYIRGDVVEILAIRHHAQREVTARDLGIE